MITAPAVISVIKYGFLGLVVTGAGFLIANTALTMRYEKSEAMEDLAYRAQPSTMNGSFSLDKNYMRCLTEPSRPFCLLSHKRRLELLKNKDRLLHRQVTHQKLVNDSSKSHPSNPMYPFLESFGHFMSSLSVKPLLLEPSVLFCMLPPLQKYGLVSNGLKSSVIQGAPNRITFGVMEKDSMLLSQDLLLNKSLESGYEFSRIGNWPEAYSTGHFPASHYFYTTNNITVRIVVFFQRDSFLWHSELDIHSSREPFGSISIYENFTQVPLLLENGQESGFYLPSRPDYFLLQIQHSEFHDCSIPSTDEKDNHQFHPSLTKDQLYHRVRIAIQELKSVLRTLMAVFWLWKDTLEGWNENCNLFQKTSEFNLALQASIFTKLNLNEMFGGNAYLRLIKNHKWGDIHQKLVLDCYGLQVNIYSMYEDTTTLWYYQGNSEGHLLKTTYLKFEVCSTSVTSQLVHIPCEKELKRIYA